LGFRVTGVTLFSIIEDFLIKILLKYEIVQYIDYCKLIIYSVLSIKGLSQFAYFGTPDN